MNNYNSEKVAEIVRVYVLIASEVYNLIDSISETKRIWHKNGKKEEWKKACGITFRNRTEHAMAQLKSVY